MGDEHYEVIRPLGRGGAGVVYQAVFHGQKSFSKQVACKVLELHTPERDESRLVREAHILGLIRHRAIVHADRLVELEGRLALIMEYVEGASLFELGACHRFPVSVAIEIVREVAGALHAAFGTLDGAGRPMGLMHRDIKGSNIMVTAAGEVKLLDFDIATEQENGTDFSDMILGTTPFIAPERMYGDDHHESDVYSLGVVLHGLLTGTQLSKSPGNVFGHGELVRAAMKSLETHTELEGVGDLLWSMLQFSAKMRPSAREVERRCHRLLERHGGVSLRDWSEHRVQQLVDLRQLHTAIDEEDTPRTPPLAPARLTITAPVPNKWPGAALVSVVCAASVISVLTALLAWPDPAPGVIRVVGDANAVTFVSDGIRYRAPLLPAGSYQMVATFNSAQYAIGEIDVRPDSDAVLRCTTSTRTCALAGPEH